MNYSLDRIAELGDLFNELSIDKSKKVVDIERSLSLYYSKLQPFIALCEDRIDVEFEYISDNNKHKTAELTLNLYDEEKQVFFVIFGEGFMSKRKLTQYGMLNITIEKDCVSKAIDTIPSVLDKLEKELEKDISLLK